MALPIPAPRPPADDAPSPARDAQRALAAACLDLPSAREPRQELADPTPSLDRCRRAIDLYDALLATAPDDPPVLAERAYAYFLMGNGLRERERHAEAVVFYFKVADHPPGRALPWHRRWLLGYCFSLRYLHLHDDLLALVEPELAARPDDGDLLLHAALARQRLRRYPEAVATYQHLLTLATGLQRATVLSNLASVYHGWEGHAAEALAAIDAALALDPDNAIYRRNRGLVAGAG